MSKFIINKDHAPATYDLIAVSNHYGGLGGGHCELFFHLIDRLPLSSESEKSRRCFSYDWLDS